MRKTILLRLIVLFLLFSCSKNNDKPIVTEKNQQPDIISTKTDKSWYTYPKSFFGFNTWYDSEINYTIIDNGKSITGGDIPFYQQVIDENNKDGCYYDYFIPEYCRFTMSHSYDSIKDEYTYKYDRGGGGDIGFGLTYKIKNGHPQIVRLFDGTGTKYSITDVNYSTDGIVIRFNQYICDTDNAEPEEVKKGITRFYNLTKEETEKKRFYALAQHMFNILDEDTLSDDATKIEFLNTLLPRMDKTDLRTLRNTVFAYYGYPFKDNKLLTLFKKFEWYKGGNASGEYIIKKMQPVHKKILDLTTAMEKK
jgi:hypothetical protein